MSEWLFPSPPSVGFPFVLRTFERIVHRGPHPVGTKPVLLLKKRGGQAGEAGEAREVPETEAGETTEMAEEITGDGTSVRQKMGDVVGA